MSDNKTNRWIDYILPRHVVLTKSVVNILEGLLKAKGIDYLTVSGRTKDKSSILEKIKRKSYDDPSNQLTDLSGIRVIVFFESDIEKVSKVIEDSFCVDQKNSLSKDTLLATDQIGYRSLHYVCDLGTKRTSLPEFEGLNGLKFEFQIRTVLQHAWAELAHDRNYKFAGKLPKDIERKLYLYASMLEIADKGFDELSTQIDKYIEDFSIRANEGDLNIDINSISLVEFVEDWSRKSGFPLDEYRGKNEFSDLVGELEQFGISTVAELNEIIPNDFVEVAKKCEYSCGIYGLVRDWMLINDFKRYRNEVSFSWNGLGLEEGEIFSSYLSAEQFDELQSLFD